jgi:hypothetical protein
MAYKSREARFPTRVFRQALDALQAQLPARAVREYLHLLPLAAPTSEAEVAAALEQLLAAGTLPTFAACRARLPRPGQALDSGRSAPVIDLTGSDRLRGGSAHG